MVHFVGAGCGAADLITLRGAELLKKAAAVIYAGSLVNPELLKHAGGGCRIYNSAEMTLEQVMAAITDIESKGGDTVRLHTGDPCLYGAIDEQMRELDAAGIAYDITPGVSSFCGAAAALRAQYTVPELCQSVIITRESGKTPVPPRESIASFAAHGASMVIFLSSSLTERLQGELLSGGYSPDTPAAIVYKATWPEERVLRCTVSTLHETAVKNKITNTALITVGGFLDKAGPRSKLYDPAFTTAFRTGEENT